MKKQDIMQLTGISKATMAKLNTNDYVSLEIIDKLCAALNCQPGDLIEFWPDSQGKSQKNGETL